jgi:hypothetical protein
MTNESRTGESRRSCITCGEAADPDDRFCSHCGAPLPVPDESGDGAMDSTFLGTAGPHSSGSIPVVGSGYVTGITPGSSVLVVSRGANAGASFLLSGDIVVAGRAPDSDLFLDDITVSRHHAEFRRDGQTWILKDADSLNGTYVNRSRVDSVTLNPGDEVQIGKYRFVYLIGGE